MPKINRGTIPPLDGVKRIDSDQQKHAKAQTADEELVDETSSLGSIPEEAEDIDKTLESVGLPSDEDGPRELNSQQVIDQADKNQE